jgi:UDP-N-acetylmuramoylalanine--D-glutamate ligase
MNPSESRAERFFRRLKGKKVAICGMGTNNTPVVLQFLQKGARVTACDRRNREQLGQAAALLEEAGASLQLGDGYLQGLEGFDLILRTPGMKPYLPEFEAARDKGIAVTSEMELFFSLCPAPIYGVTGSDGKSTTTSVIAGLLEAGGKKVHLGGNIGRPLLPLIGEIGPEDAAVVELSSFQLTRMTQSPHVAVITNIAPNHLDWHTDMDEYVEAKRNLIAYQQAGDRMILNADNAYTAGFARDMAGKSSARVLLFSRRHPVEEGAWMDESGTLKITIDGKTSVIMESEDILLPGDHIREDFLAAIAAVWGEVSPAAIKTYACRFGGIAHRCELVREWNGVRWINDSIGTSPTRTIAGLESFDRPVILIAGGYDKHIPYAPLGPVVARKVKTAILMGDTADAIEKAIRENGDTPVIRVSDMEQAVNEAARLAGSGEIVLMSPASASFDMYKNFEEKGDHFKRLVNAL